jgi:hypothetical protein
MIMFRISNCYDTSRNGSLGKDELILRELMERKGMAGVTTSMDSA